MTRRSWSTGASLAIGCALALRALIFLTHSPLRSLDSASYEALARAIAGFDARGYSGERTPLYPAVLLAMGLDARLVYALQTLAFASVVAILLHRLVRDLSRERVAFVATLAYALDPYAITYDAFVLTEATSALLTMAMVFAVHRALHAKDARQIVRAWTWAAITCGLGAITRPISGALVPLLLLAAHLHSRALSARARLVLRGRVAGLALAPVLALSVFNAAAVGAFAPTTLTGYTLTQHVGGFVESAPDRFSQLRDIYLSHRSVLRAQSGTHSMTIWAARPEMMRVTGLSHAQLSRELTRMCIATIAARPLAYAASVTRSFLRFFGAPNLRALGWLALPSALWDLAEATLIATKAVAFAAAIAAVAAWVRSRRLVLGASATIAALLFANSAIAQALFESGENDRYAVPLQPVALAVAAVALARLAAWLRSALPKYRAARRTGAQATTEP